ncbi:Rhotekin-2 [Trichoplax sp. H2]|nr:Rhotekin-2 [Trichoplax sp. H2]|eukprot:RDD42380.1 Rhotekin-2 [Trichoplax sp. H2]
MESTANRYSQQRRYVDSDRDMISAAIKNKAKMQEGRTQSNYLEDKSLQSNIDHEITMRDGINKFLAATQLNTKQALGASKNLITCNTRIMTWMSMLQKQHEVCCRQEYNKKPSKQDNEWAFEPCKSKLSLSEIKIPLQWKNVDVTTLNKENIENHTYSLFCVLKLGSEVLDTGLIYDIDKALKIVTFDDVITFNSEVDSKFILEIQVYCAISSTDSHLKGNQHKSNRRKFGKSDKDDANSQLSSNSYKYYVIGHAYLNQSNASKEPQTHILYEGAPSGLSASSTSASAPFDLPTTGAFSCRLYIKPNCSGEEIIKDYINVQLTVEGMPAWIRFWCCLRQIYIYGWMFSEDEEKNQPTKVAFELTKDSKIERAPRLRMRRLNSLLLSNVLWNGKLEEVFLSAESKDDRDRWMEAISQAIANIKAWGDHCRSTEKIVQPTHQSKLFKSIRSYGDITSSAEKQEIDSCDSNIKRDSANSVNDPAKKLEAPPRKTRVRVRQHVSVEVIRDDMPESGIERAVGRPREECRGDVRTSNVRTRRPITTRNDGSYSDSQHRRRIISEKKEYREVHLASHGCHQKRSFDECSSPRRIVASPRYDAKVNADDKRPRLIVPKGTPRKYHAVPPKASLSELENI